MQPAITNATALPVMKNIGLDWSSCPYDCYLAKYTQSYVATLFDGSEAIFESNFRDYKETEIEAWNFLEIYHPINFTQICYYDSRNPEIYLYEYSPGT